MSQNKEEYLGSVKEFISWTNAYYDQVGRGNAKLLFRISAFGYVIDGVNVVKLSYTSDNAQRGVEFKSGGERGTRTLDLRLMSLKPLVFHRNNYTLIAL